MTHRPEATNHRHHHQVGYAVYLDDHTHSCGRYFRNFTPNDYVLPLLRLPEYSVPWGIRSESRMITVTHGVEITISRQGINSFPRVIEPSHAVRFQVPRVFHKIGLSCLL